MLALERELHREAGLAGVNPPGQQRQILWQQRPALAQFVRRPQPLRPTPPLSAPKQATLRSVLQSTAGTKQASSP